MATLALAGGSVWACRCLEPGNAAAYRGAKAVVRANVLNVTGDAEGPGGAVMRMSVLQSWKGNVPATVEVSTSTTCGYVFEAGKEYLVYLRRGTEGAALITRRCMGNRLITQAQPALQWLGKHGKTMPSPPAR